MSVFYYGLLLGFGAAIPLGPINLEMMRRNLHFGTLHGLSLGLGASIADLVYVSLLCIGVLPFLTHPIFLKVVGIMGACILAWFGYKALQLKTNPHREKKLVKKPLLTTWVAGFMLTMVNPYTIIFWASVSSQLISVTEDNSNAIILAALGVITAAVGWCAFFNLFLHFTKSKLNVNVIHWLNISGGVILIGFAIYGFINAVL
jgi:L-lysine exporter family protein LysE/ArgO